MPKLIQEYVTRSAELYPDRAAIVWKDETIPYAEMDRLTNQLAHLLRSVGCEKGDRVAFLIPKSPNAILTMVGTLKADCVYVPIDTDCPAARVAKVIEACQPKVIMAASSVKRLLDELFANAELTSNITVGTLEAIHLEGQHFATEFTGLDVLNQPAETPAYKNTSKDAAHLLFTSGSTGTPKGVVIPHGNVIAFVEWARHYFQMDEHDRVSGHAPLHFDLSTYDTYGAFAAGAELHPVPPELNLLPNKLADFIRSRELTQWFSVPAILNYLFKFSSVKDGDFPSLKRLMWCGEVLPTPTLMYLMERLPLVQFTNLYGPTEATIASSYYTVPICPEYETDAIPIGQPCDGEELLVLDAQLQPTSFLEIGDLYIGGVGLSPGYWQDQTKTDAVFIRHPVTGQRIYKTGDLAKLGDDGLVYFLGRADTQIKSRGYRIELGEIEAGLHALSFLDESAIVAIDTDGFENKEICCAFVAKPDSDVTVPMLKRELGKHVPKYMVPAMFLEFDALPKNGNGKIDRPRLRAMFADQTKPASVAVVVEA